MKKTVIFGGTFNPPHLGHETMVREICRREDVEKLLLVPTKQPVHKVGVSLASSEHRLKMCELLSELSPKAQVWDVEIKRTGKSYTYLTLLDYRERFGDTPWFLCGADMLVTLKTWYKYEELIKLCNILAVFRMGEDYGEFSKSIEEIRKDGATVHELTIRVEDLSSTEVRSAVSIAGDLRQKVSEKIAKYIEDNNLYKEKSDMTIQEYKEHIKERLSPRRYFHSLCVAEEAVRLADRYGADKEKAYLAGLLHDVLKDTKQEEQLKLAKEFGIMLTDLELNAPKLYHSIVGSAYVEKVLGIEDEDVIKAIRYHTTARADMSPLETVLYLADYTSRDRDYDGVEDMRRAVEVSAEEALRIALQFTVEDLKKKGASVHPDTLAAYDFYLPRY